MLAYPVAMTHDAWDLGENLPGLSAIIIVILSLALIA